MMALLGYRKDFGGEDDNVYGADVLGVVAYLGSLVGLAVVLVGSADFLAHEDIHDNVNADDDGWFGNIFFR